MKTQYQNKAIRLIMYLRSKGITDTDVLSAIERVPRHEFVGAQVIDKAWEDMALPIGLGQTISQPLVVAMMTQALELKSGDKLLEIGTGCGYQAAVLSHLCRRVYTIERHKPLLQAAEERFADLRIRNITAIAADGMKGWPTINGIDQAPFNKIIVTAAAREKPPERLLNQLKEGGMLIIPVGGSGNQMLKKFTRETEDITVVEDIMPVRFVPLLPDIAKYEDKKQEAI